MVSRTLTDRTNPSFFSSLPLDIINLIGLYDQAPNSDIAKALGLAASGIEEDMVKLEAMVGANPSLLLEAGNVRTRGGVEVIRVTLYEFFLGEGDPDGAKRIEFGFAKIKDKEGKPCGEAHRLRQAEGFKEHIDALAKQIESGEPAYDLQPLIKVLKVSSAKDVTAALNKDRSHESALRDALIKFRQAVEPKTKTKGMHYEHYTTLLQAFKLLGDEWGTLSNNGANDDKCDLFWRQVIGYLQLKGLPAVDRMKFARGFDSNERNLSFKYEPFVSLSDVPASVDESLDVAAGLGFDYAGSREEGRAGWRQYWGRAGFASLKNTFQAKTTSLQNLCSPSHQSNRPCV